MRVKWNRNLDGNTIIDTNETLSNYKEDKSANLPIETSETSKFNSSKSSSPMIPMRSRSRETSGKSNRGCNLIFGSTRKSTSRSASTSATQSSISSSSSASSRSSSSPPPTDRHQQSTSPTPPVVQGSSSSDRTTMTKLSNFLGIFKLTPSSASSTNGSIKGSTKSSASQPTSIKVVRRSNGSKSGYESDGLFRTDSRRRRRANSLLQRNSDIRRSWNAAMTGRPEVSVRGPWLRSGSPNYRPSQGGVILNGSNGSRPSSSLDGSGHFANSCKVNSMPAPIVTLPECCLEGSDSEGINEYTNGTNGGSGYDSKSSKPGYPSQADLEIEHHHQYQHQLNSDDDDGSGCDEVDLISNNNNNNIGDKIQHNGKNKANGSIVRPTGPPPPPPTSSTTSVSYDWQLTSVDDVFIQVQITASSTKCTSPERQQLQQSTPNSRQQTINGQLPNGKLTDHQMSSSNICDESDRPLSPIFESCTEKVNYEESISPTGSLTDSRLDSRSSGEVEEEEDVNTFFTLRPPSSTAGSSSTEMTLSEDGGLGESVSCDASSGCSWETSSILTGSVCLSPDGSTNTNQSRNSSGHQNNHHHHNGESANERMSPSPTYPTTSTPQHNHHSSLHHPTSPIMISDPMFNNNSHHQVNSNSNSNSNHSNTPTDESYLYEPRMSEVIRVTVKKAEIPEVVTLRSEDIIDLDTSGSIGEENGSPSSPSSSISSLSISSVQRVHTSGGSSKGNRTGILKDSNCLNSNGVHTCRGSTPKKVHFAESAKIRTRTVINNHSDHLNHLQKCVNYDSRSSPRKACDV